MFVLATSINEGIELGVIKIQKCLAKMKHKTG